jgi:hypothetical protein
MTFLSSNFVKADRYVTACGGGPNGYYTIDQCTDSQNTYVTCKDPGNASCPFIIIEDFGDHSSENIKWYNSNIEKCLLEVEVNNFADLKKTLTNGSGFLYFQYESKNNNYQVILKKY